MDFLLGWKVDFALATDLALAPTGRRSVPRLLILLVLTASAWLSWLPLITGSLLGYINKCLVLHISVDVSLDGLGLIIEELAG